tara:strand:- start:3408 stop:3701 length:294 start_codon:yes stop_codon:yes gene_type:complete
MIICKEKAKRYQGKSYQVYDKEQHRPYGHYLYRELGRVLIGAFTSLFEFRIAQGERIKRSQVSGMTGMEDTLREESHWKKGVMMAPVLSALYLPSSV